MQNIFLNNDTFCFHEIYLQLDFIESYNISKNEKIRSSSILRKILPFSRFLSFDSFVFHLFYCTFFICFIVLFSFVLLYFFSFVLLYFFHLFYCTIFHLFYCTFFICFIVLFLFLRHRTFSFLMVTCFFFVQLVYFSIITTPCPVGNMTLNNLMVRFQLLGLLSTPLLPLLHGSLKPGVVAPDSVLSLGQIELNCVLRLN